MLGEGRQTNTRPLLTPPSAVSITPQVHAPSGSVRLVAPWCRRCAPAHITVIVNGYHVI